MSSKRRHERFVRRLETEFTAEDKKYRGISGNLSENGLFLRTNHAFTPGTILDITIHLPDGAISTLKGKVMRALKTPFVSVKNGMGIEFIEKDSYYINFMKAFSADEQEKTTAEEVKPETETHTKTEETTESASPDFLIVSCLKCGVKNKVHQSKKYLGPKCGKCGSLLNMETTTDKVKPETETHTKTEETTESASPDFLIVSCPKCGVKNKIHQSKISLDHNHKCGKCDSLLKMEK